jgi:hypothetical protein
MRIFARARNFAGPSGDFQFGDFQFLDGFVGACRIFGRGYQPKLLK